MTSDSNWATKMINIAVEFGATLVEDDHYEERVKICGKCPYQDLVTLPIPGAGPVKGCTLCGCPTDTKPRYKRYFSFKLVRMTDAVCPDGRWEEVDSLFNSKLNQNASST